MNPTRFSLSLGKFLEAHQWILTFSIHLSLITCSLSLPILVISSESDFHFFNPTMKFTKIIPKNLFKSKKSSRSVSRSESEPSSFSTTSSSASDHDDLKKPTGSATPTTVLSSVSDVHLDLKHAFVMLDRDGDGKIEKHELEILLRRLGAAPPCQEELNLMLNDVDSDGDGCITLEEFYSIGEAFAPPACDDELREAFDFFDSDRDGRITAEELFRVFETIGDALCTLEECRRMIGGVDCNGDGFVCFEDFSRMMDQHQR